jgi:hypothetical protein
MALLSNGTDPYAGGLRGLCPVPFLDYSKFPSNGGGRE